MESRSTAGVSTRGRTGGNAASTSASALVPHDVADTCRRRRYLIAANVLGLVLSVPVLVTGSLLFAQRHVYCITFIEKPMIWMGILLFLVSLAGLLSVRLPHVPQFYWLHLIALFLLVILLFCFAIFSIDVTSTSSGGDGGGYYTLSGYPKWMRQKVRRKHEWLEIVDCLKKNGYCSASSNNNLQLANGDASPATFAIQLGCCKAPPVCNSNVGAIEDCVLWNNDPNQLCYQCSSCRAGVIQTTKDRWSKAGTILLVVPIIIVTFYVILGSIAVLHERKHDL